jgi:FKBP-type peptidyl-prolyl cis-trans isomerase
VFQLGEKQMHEGFERGLQHMCVGERRKIVVPSDLAYGEVGGYGSESVNKIKPNATLVYKVSRIWLNNFAFRWKMTNQFLI